MPQGHLISRKIHVVKYRSVRNIFLKVGYFFKLGSSKIGDTKLYNYHTVLVKGKVKFPYFHVLPHLVWINSLILIYDTLESYFIKLLPFSLIFNSAVTFSLD